MARSSRHWYSQQPNGSVEPRHGLGIKEARQQKLFASPTTVLSEVRATPFHLERWKRQQLVAACMDSPPKVYEDGSIEHIDLYYDRVNELSFRKSDVATDFGKRIHSIAEHYPAQHIDPALQPWYEQFKLWHDEHVEQDLAQEECVADKDLGVAGTLDRRIVLRGTHEITVIDVKTQGIKDRVYYGDSWCPQLATYANAIRKRDSLPMNPKCINVIIDSTAPNKLITKEWSSEEINEAYQDFVCVLWLWSRECRHWPVGQWSLAEVLNNPYLCPR